MAKKSFLRKKPRKETKRPWREKIKGWKTKPKDIKIITDIALRYLLLLVASANNLWIFYFLFTAITIQASALLLRFFYPVTVYSNINVILVEESIINMVKACIAGAAYYLLLILNLTTRKIRFKKRILIFLFDAMMFFILNIARIAVLIIMQVKNLAAFDITHKILWYGISTLYVVFIWLLTVKIFSIKEIPIYSDFTFLKKQLKKKQ